MAAIMSSGIPQPLSMILMESRSRAALSSISMVISVAPARMELWVMSMMCRSRLFILQYHLLSLAEGVLEVVKTE